MSNKFSFDDIIKLAEKVKKWEEDGWSSYTYHGSFDDIKFKFVINPRIFSPDTYTISAICDGITLGKYNSKDPKIKELYKKIKANIEQQEKDKIKTVVNHTKDLLKENEVL